MAIRPRASQTRRLLAVGAPCTHGVSGGASCLRVCFAAFLIEINTHVRTQGLQLFGNQVDQPQLVRSISLCQSEISNKFGMGCG